MTRSKMPTKKQLNIYHGRDADDDECMACGRAHALHRAHIMPRCAGGTDEPDNLHLLCPVCHYESEHWINDGYKAWYDSRQGGAGIDEAYNAAMSVVLEVANERLAQHELSKEEKQSVETEILKQFRS